MKENNSLFVQRKSLLINIHDSILINLEYSFATTTTHQKLHSFENNLQRKPF